MTVCEANGTGESASAEAFSGESHHNSVAVLWQATLHTAAADWTTKVEAQYECARWPQNCVAHIQTKQYGGRESSGVRSLVDTDDEDEYIYGQLDVADDLLCTEVSEDLGDVHVMFTHEHLPDVE